MSKSAQARSHYSAVAIVLHWLIAAAIVFQVIIAWRMGGGRTPEGFALVQLHKSIGITVLLLSLARLAWRLTHRPPPLPAGMATWEKVLAKVAHVGLYVIMIGLPITGWIMVSASRIQVPTLLYGVVPWPHVPGLAHVAEPAKSAWHGFGETGHEVLAWGAYVLVALHVAGALKHQLFSKDEPVLAHMAPGTKPGAWLDPRLIGIVVAALAVIGAGYAVRPAPPASKPLPPPPLVVEEAPVEAPAAMPVETPAAPAAETQAEAAAPSAWKVNAGSTLGFATAWGGSAIEGRFDRWTADILFSPEALDKSKVSVSIDLTSAVSGDSQRDESLQGADWFDTASHAKATFTASRFEKTGENRYVAIGTLTLRGVARPQRLPFTLKIEGDKARVSGVTTLDRTAFGVGQGEWKSTDQIPAEVKVSVNLTATRR
ncbi:MAG: cytochrome b [Phenylobacterium sp.]|uniref:YceI family protein n=1 Tax=Phenylobacterium sp. TaxID=1871053 RepID=UPI0025D610DC|nr:YceI family protein [Phenylobacterium sp.]MBA4012639.1 cytochrome b [Phenylobacterium sp.]